MVEPGRAGGGGRGARGELFGDQAGRARLLHEPIKDYLWPRWEVPLLGTSCPLPPTDLAHSELLCLLGAQAVFSTTINLSFKKEQEEDDQKPQARALSQEEKPAGQMPAGGTQ